MLAISRRAFHYIWHPSNETFKNNVYLSVSFIDMIIENILIFKVFSFCVKDVR